jgi:hypothetical protein
MYNQRAINQIIFKNLEKQHKVRTVTVAKDKLA